MVIDDVYSFSGLASKEAMSCENKILDLVVELNRGIHDAQVSDEGTTGSLGTAIFLTQARVILRGYQDDRLGHSEDNHKLVV